MPAPNFTRLLAAFLWLTLMTACSADLPLNPSFPLTLAEAQRDLERMAADPKPFARPVVISAGYFDPGVIVGRMMAMLRPTTFDDTQFIAVSYFGVFDINDCRDRLNIRVAEAIGCSLHDLKNHEVDVIGFSMGGLIARDAAREDGDRPQLNIKRLFTISTPHRGARMAKLPNIDPRVNAMRADSDYIRRLDEVADPNYQIMTYARLDDMIVGEHNTSLNHAPPWWVANPPFALGHIGAATDPRFIADIARRLRSEPPFTSNPPDPLPVSKPSSADPDV